MASRKGEEWEELLPRRIEEKMRDLIEEFLPERWIGPRWLRRGWGPALDFYETEDAYHLEVDLPGWKKEEIKIQKKGDVLEIVGEKKEEREIKEENFIRRERRSGSFVRRVPIPEEADISGIKARFEGGVLKAIIPKKKVEKEPEITVEIE
ncbi:MAG: Hsp20/alpha crystallin family protein [bacterium JZ-2024 1]